MDTDENKKTRWEGKRSLSLLSLVCLVCAALSLGNLIARQSGNHPRGGPLPAIEPQVSAVAATPSGSALRGPVIYFLGLILGPRVERGSTPSPRPSSLCTRTAP